jgi:hypothetical protein
MYEIMGNNILWHETTKQVAHKEKMAGKLKKMREPRDLADESVYYAINHTLCENRVDRQVYHGQCLIGP